ncbi:maltose ABC transporter permease MalF, partial [Klebsiella pneumoniae]
FPLACTVAIAFTNYSSTNQLSEARAQQVLLSRQYQAGDAMNFALYSQGDRWQLALSAGENSFLSAPFTLGGEQQLSLTPAALPATARASLKTITQNRQGLSQLTARLPDGRELVMSSLRQFSGTRPLYVLDAPGQLRNQQNGA